MTLVATGKEKELYQEIDKLTHDIIHLKENNFTKIEKAVLLRLAQNRLEKIDKTSMEYHELGHIIEKLQKFT